MKIRKCLLATLRTRSEWLMMASPPHGWLLGSFIFDINFGHERGFHALALNKQINNQTYNINIHGNTTYTHVQQCVLQLCRILFIKDKMLTTKMVS